MASLTSTTTGTVYESSYENFTLRILPTITLADNHPFIQFWQDFLQNITNPMTSGSLSDAFLDVYLGDKEWKKDLNFVQIGTRREEIRDILRDNPPDIIILNQPLREGYGRHQRSPEVWKYICVGSYWVEEWMNAMEFDPDRRLTLALECLLKAILVHETAHWLSTLALGVNPVLPDSRRLTRSVSRLHEVEHASQSTGMSPKCLAVQWKGNDGEAGNYVEVKAGGGIVGYNVERDDVYYQTGANSFWSPSTNFLKDMRNKGFPYFNPKSSFKNISVPAPGLLSVILPSTPTTPIYDPHLSALNYDSDIAAFLMARRPPELQFEDGEFLGEIPKHGSLFGPGPPRTSEGGITLWDINWAPC